MRAWTLRVRFGLYAGVVTAVISVLGLLTISPIIFRHQLAELDSQLAEDAEEVFGDLTKYGGSQINFRKPILFKFIPASLRLRYLQINGPEGQMLYRSKNLRELDLSSEAGGMVTILIADQKARIGTFHNGFLTVRIGTRLGRLEAMQEDLGQVMLWVAPSAGLAAFLLGWLLAGHALKPLKLLTAAAEKIEPAQPYQPLPQPTAKDEIFRLSEVLNHTFERLQHAYATTEKFSADASHQLKTPLAVLRLGLESLRQAADTTPEQREKILALERQTRHLSSLVQDLLLLAQADAGQLQLEPDRLDLQSCVDDALEDLEIYCSEKDIQLKTETTAELWVHGDVRKIAIILQNLTENAVKYTPADGEISIQTLVQNQNALVRVANTSQPIPPHVREHLFRRFHRGETTENVSGHGLGLNIARSFARAQGGDVILAEPSPDAPNLVTFEFWLPLLKNA